MSVFPSMLLPLSDIAFSRALTLRVREGENRSWSVPATVSLPRQGCAALSPCRSRTHAHGIAGFLRGSGADVATGSVTTLDAHKRSRQQKFIGYCRGQSEQQHPSASTEGPTAG